MDLLSPKCAQKLERDKKSGRGGGVVENSPGTPDVHIYALAKTQVRFIHAGTSRCKRTLDDACFLHIFVATSCSSFEFFACILN